jgi:hypothetical protein
MNVFNKNISYYFFIFLYLLIFFKLKIQIYQANPFFFINSSICLPIKEGDFDTTIPASYKAFILLIASPFPFCTIAPA